MHPRRTQRGVAGYKKLLPVWTDLMVKRFRCGHERTEANTIINRYFFGTKMREQPRCRACHNQNGLAYAKKCRGKRQRRR